MVAPRSAKCRNVLGGVITAVLLVLPGGCNNYDATADPVIPVASVPSVFVDELALHEGKVCPKRLPTGDDPKGYGFGTEEPATVVPTIAIPDKGWVCLYAPVEGPRQPDGDAFFKWIRGGSAIALGASSLAELSEQVSELAPPTGWAERMCTADLGPRWMLVISTQGDLTGVVIDDYGCNDVRLTDEPFKTAPGEAEQIGTVPGVLDALTCRSCAPLNRDLLRAIKNARRQ